MKSAQQQRRRHRDGSPGQAMALPPALAPLAPRGRAAPAAAGPRCCLTVLWLPTLDVGTGGRLVSDIFAVVRHQANEEGRKLDG